MSNVRVEHVCGGAVARLVLDRPDTMNALTEELMTEFFDLLRQANADRAVRVLVVTGAGNNFSAGGDLKWEQDFDEESATNMVRLFGHVSYELRNGPKPVIAAVRGYCLGGGHELSLHADVVIASETALFGQPETKWGLLPFWYTPQLLPLVVGERRAREMLLFGRTYDADQALDMGLCNLVVPDDQLEAHVEGWATELLERSSVAMRLVKLALNSASEAMRGAANHDAALVTVTSGSARYRDEVGRFFEQSPASRRPKRAGARRVRADEHPDQA